MAERKVTLKAERMDGKRAADLVAKKVGGLDVSKVASTVEMKERKRAS